MTHNIKCSSIRSDEIEMRGDALTFSLGADKETYYLSEEAMVKLIEELGKALYNRMAAEIVHLEREKDELRSRIDYEMNDHRQQVEEGKADWAVKENL